ncbi:MAG: class II glutamine amidotransferase [Lachnospiraceae bacterium]|nr:class II glutamine amidotransferase [Lachnospiraceae bacterium]
MCQLFGFSGNEHLELNNVLKEFYSHSDKHPNGWGLALLDGTHANIEREVVAANKSEYLAGRLKDKVKSPAVLAHIRYATIGNVELKNCHPFTKIDADGRRWTLIHNGTIFDYTPMDEYIRKQKGDTDSERILLYLIDKINGKRSQKESPLTSRERFDVLDEYICEMSENNKLNLIIYDGELMYVHSNLKDSLHYYKGKCGVLFSTEPLVNSSIFYGDGHPGEKRFSAKDWKPLPITTLVAYKGAELEFEGQRHGIEYHEDAEALKHIYMAYANL